MEDNLTADAIFYTFSTIAQVLAAIIALFGAALIFIINRFPAQLFDIGKAQRNILKSEQLSPKRSAEIKKQNKLLEDFETAFNCSDLLLLKANIEKTNQFAAHLTKDHLSSLFYISINTKKREFEKLEKKRDSYKIDSKNTIIFNSVILILSVIVLPFTKLLENHPCITIIVFFALISLFIFGFYKIIKLINRVFEK